MEVTFDWGLMLSLWLNGLIVAVPPVAFVAIYYTWRK